MSPDEFNDHEAVSLLASEQESAPAMPGAIRVALHRRRTVERVRSVSIAAGAVALVASASWVVLGPGPSAQGSAESRTVVQETPEPELITLEDPMFAHFNTASTLHDAESARRWSVGSWYSREFPTDWSDEL